MRPIDIRGYKQDLRARSKERRRNMKSEEKQLLDKAVADNVRRLKEYRPAKTILIYMSTPIEVDTIGIIKNAWADGKRVAVPRCIPNTRDMEFHYIDNLDCLSVGTNHFPHHPDPGSAADHFRLHFRSAVFPAAAADHGFHAHHPAG